MELSHQEKLKKSEEMKENKYIEMIEISAQIEALKELSYQTVYKLNDLKMKSDVLMDDFIKILGEKRTTLAKLNGTEEINKLKKIITTLEEKNKQLENGIIKKYKFYKDPDTRWYVDLPEWEGTKAELEMVAGADEMLEHMSKGKSEVSLMISIEPFYTADVLTLKGPADDIGEGAYYNLEIFQGEKINIDMWLCNVVLWLYKEFPTRLYISQTL